MLLTRVTAPHSVCVFVCLRSSLTACTWCCWWGCLKIILFLCTTSSSPPRASSRRWIQRCDSPKWANLSYNCTLFWPLRFTTCPSPLSWCKMEAWRNLKPEQKVVVHLLKNYSIRKNVELLRNVFKKMLGPSYLRLTSRWKPLLTMLEAFSPPLWSTFLSWFSKLISLQPLKNYCFYDNKYLLISLFYLY